ncbi:MAG: trypsin-like peptidase domain-containing protein [Hyphomonadaceae bacterium]
MSRGASAAALAAAFFLAAPAGAVAIGEAAWRAHGGDDPHWDRGFGPSEALAAAPQFRAMVSLTEDGRGWGVASGVWIGNDAAGHAYILTAGHVAVQDVRARRVRARTSAGAVLTGMAFFTHPAWNNDVGRRGGMDFAILKLDGPITDSGPAPALYGGRQERGRRAVLIGYGERGVAPFGVGLRFAPKHGLIAAAAENVIDRVTPFTPGPDGADWGNELRIDFDEADGPGKNRMGAASPVSFLEGVLAPGDSGGALWVNFSDHWRIVGVNSSGAPGADYQDVSSFARVTTQKAWIRSIFPQARFEGGKTD